MIARNPQREPLIVHDVPERPWQKVGCDIFHPRPDGLSVYRGLLLWLLQN